MSTLRRRLADIEEQQAFRKWQEDQREFEGRSQGDLQFFALYGYFPDSLEDEVPQREEFTVAGIRTVITAERHPQGSQVAAENQSWLDLGSIAVVEITSEEKEFPIESALLPGEQRGWRAAVSGAQTIRLRFDQPQRLTRIRLSFEETQAPRTQEFVLRFSSDAAGPLRDIVR